MNKTAAILFGLLTASIAQAVDSPAPPVLPSNVHGKDGVKAYLLAICKSCVDGTHKLKTAAGEYQQLVQSAGSEEAAAKKDPAKVADLIAQMRADYQQIDSFGYEYMEGIVAGVDSLQHYDVELDSGVPKKEAGPNDQVADLVIHAGKTTVDHQGSLNNYLIEPTVYGTNAEFTAGSAALPGSDKPTNLPKAELIVALADYAVDGYGRLQADATKWQPSDADCYKAIYAMTPTLADYFDEWKESKNNGGAPGGRFVAVRRVSDMRGIMSSVQLTWQGVASETQQKDAALADNISRGYGEVLKFIDTVDSRDQQKPLTAEAIDALGSQAKERADKLTVQTEQAAKLAGVEVAANK